MTLPTPEKSTESGGKADMTEPVSLDLGTNSKPEPFDIELCFSSHLAMISIVGPLMNKLARLSGLDSSAAYEVELCAVEAVTNSIEHGCGLSGEHEVKVGFHIDTDRLEVRVLDTAPPANLDQGPLDQSSDGSMAVPDLDGFRGRGLFIMSELMESISFETRQDGPWRNQLTMARSLSDQAEA